MAELVYGIPDQYDIALDGKGYLIAQEVDHPGTLSTTYIRGSYIKQGPDLQVPRQDYSQDISENKLDGFYRSGQRSWFDGGGQKRLDNPKTSDQEQFLRAKNADCFFERGALSISHALYRVQTGVAGGTQAKGYATASDQYLYWACPVSGTPTNTNLKSINLWADTPTVRSLDANWTAGSVVDGLCNDGLYVYASNLTQGIFRGLLSQQSTTINRWSTQGLRDIAFIKERILGHTTSGGQVQVWQIDTITGTAQQVGTNFPPGFSISVATGKQQVFAQVQGFAVWAMTAGRDGYLYTWDGTNNPVKAAVFPGWQAWGVVSYAENNLYVIARDPAGSPFGSRWALIQCNVSASGNITWQILHTVDDLPCPRTAIQDTEILFPVRLNPDDYAGLTSDANVVSGHAYAVSALNVATNGMVLGRNWGRWDVAPTIPTLQGQTWGDTGFAEPDICVFRNALTLVGENGEIRAESTKNAATAELILSAHDFNIESPKTFLLGEFTADQMPANCSAVLQFTDDDPDQVTAAWSTAATINPNEKTQRGRLGSNGTQASTLWSKLVLYGGPDTPTIRRADVAAIYAQKPTYEHTIHVKCYNNMTLRNGNSWPTERGPDTILKELQDLRDGQNIVDYQEPSMEGKNKPPVKVQVREVEWRLVHVPNSGWSSVIVLVLKEMPGA